MYSCHTSMCMQTFFSLAKLARDYAAQRKYFLSSKQPARFSVVCVRCSSDLPIKPDSTGGM